MFLREAIQTEKLPLDVHIASDGELALAFIARAEKDPNAPSPHALVLDLNLPKIDGFEVLRRIRANDKFRNIPVLIVTSSDSPLDRGKASELGVRYFRKPVTYGEFLKIGPFIRQFLTDSGLLPNEG